MYKIKVSYFNKDDNYNLVGNPICKTYEGDTLKGCMALYRADSWVHDCAKYSPSIIYDVINTDEH